MNHFDELTCMLYLDGQLDRAQAAEMIAHAESCTACSALLAALQQESRLLRDAVREEDEAAPARLLERPGRDPISWAWIVGLGLAGAGAYTLWTALVIPVRQQLTQAGFGGGNLLTMMFISGAFWQGWSAMKTLLELISMATLGIVLLTVFRRHWRRWTTVGIVMGMLLAGLLLPGPAQAAEAHKGDPDYTLPAGEVVKHDLAVTANSVEIDGDVDGDLFVFARHLEVSGHVSGDVIAFVRETSITGRVDGNVRGACESLYIGGQVGKAVTTWSALLELAPKSQIGGSLTAGTDDLRLNGRVARDLTVFAHAVNLNGFIGGDFQERGEQLRISPGAEIDGKAFFKGREQPVVSAQAKLASPLKVEIMKERAEYASAHYYWAQAVLWGALFLYGLVLILLMPRLYLEVVRSSERYAASFGLGLVALILTPILAIIACITLVGIPLGISALFFYLMALFSAQTFVGVWIGEKMLGEATTPGGTIGRLALGLLIVRIIRNVPQIGGLLVLLLTMWALGALLLALDRRMRLRPAGA